MRTDITNFNDIHIHVLKNAMFQGILLMKNNNKLFFYPCTLGWQYILNLPKMSMLLQMDE